MARLNIHITRSLVCLVVFMNMSIPGVTNPVLAGEDPGDLYNYSFAVWLVSFDRVGIDYRWGDEGFRGV